MKKTNQETNGDLEDLSEDIDEIGKDTDKILKQLRDQLKIQSSMIGQLSKTKQAVWIVIVLWLVDKLVMSGLIMLLGN